MIQPKVLIACLHCDRKAHNQLIPHESIVNQEYENKVVYYTIETVDVASESVSGGGENGVFGPLYKKIAENPAEIHFDRWQFKSTWWRKPQFDQDQARLVPICMGRNMCIEAAIGLGADWLMFIDSDMICPPDTVSRFLQTAKQYNRPVVFGEVKGRNEHKGAEYFFPGRYGNSAKDLGDGVFELHHGNIGFAIIHKSVFQKLRFRSGPYILDETLTELQSDDPNFITDAVYGLDMPWPVLDRKIKAAHIDETIIPFGEGAQY